MTATLSIDPDVFLHEQLAQASPDLMQELLTTFINALSSAQADSVCGAEYGARDPERTNRRVPLSTGASSVSQAEFGVGWGQVGGEVRGGRTEPSVELADDLIQEDLAGPTVLHRGSGIPVPLDGVGDLVEQNHDVTHGNWPAACWPIAPGQLAAA